MDTGWHSVGGVFLPRSSGSLRLTVKGKEFLLVEVVCGWMVVQTSFGHEGMREKENYLGRVFCVVFHSCTCTQECCLSCFSWSVLMIEYDNIRDSYLFSEV